MLTIRYQGTNHRARSVASGVRTIFKNKHAHVTGGSRLDAKSTEYTVLGKYDKRVNASPVIGRVIVTR